MKKYLPLLIPLAFFVTSAILVTCNGCSRPPTSSWQTLADDGISFLDHYSPHDQAIALQDNGCHKVKLSNQRATCLVWTKDLPKRLPHRPLNELTNWGQGRAPTPHKCPRGTIEFEIDGLFLECENVGHYYRGTTQ